MLYDGPAKPTAVQNLKQAIEQRLQRLLQQIPLRTDFQRHHEEIVAGYNREKDRVTIEQTFEALLRYVSEMAEEETHATHEGLDEESLAVLDLLRNRTFRIRRSKEARRWQSRFLRP
jgi:type I restriction enzyme R subunit